VPLEAHWLAEYLHELTTFPRGKYDDQVDSTSQALAWLKKPEPNALRFYEKLYMDMMDREGGMVRLLAPPGRTHFTNIFGSPTNPIRFLRSLSFVPARRANPVPVASA
jgi:hypothetical protein